MLTAPNQKVVTIYKAKCDTKNQYSKTNIEVEAEAMRDLKHTTFKLWRYLSWNQDGYNFALSSKDVADKTGLSIATFPSCVKELIENGYLIPRKEGSNCYSFFERSFNLTF